MASPGSERRVKPCPVCGGQCLRFPDTPVHKHYPFLPDSEKGAAPERPAPRPKGKRRPAEDRAHHLEEDR